VVSKIAELRNAGKLPKEIIIAQRLKFTAPLVLSGSLPARSNELIGSWGCPADPDRAGNRTRTPTRPLSGNRLRINEDSVAERDEFEPSDDLANRQ
jgi:hypothetical protein